MGKPTPITKEEFIKTVAMFYVNNQLEKEFSDLVENDVKTMVGSLVGITTMSGLKSYILSDSDALDKITSLLNISSEKFKRIVTMLRIEKGYVPTGEWDNKKLRTEMISNPKLMDEICDLLMSGKYIQKYKRLIPEFYLDNFCIDAKTIGRLASEDDIRRLVKKGYEGRYNNKLGDAYFEDVSKKILKMCDREGLDYVVKCDSISLGDTVSIAIPNASEPRIVINIIYTLTTSSSQTKYAERQEKIRQKMRQMNVGKEDNESLILVNILDGAGWVARQSDLEKIYRCSDYMLNINQLGKFEEIIKYYL